jgi:hypothetical protein
MMMKRYWFLSLLLVGVCAWCQTENPLINYASGWGECEVDFERDGIADLWNDTSSTEAGAANLSVQYQIDRDNPISGTGCQQVSVSGDCTLDRYVVAARSEWITATGGNYPAPGDTVYVDFAYRTSANLTNVQYAAIAGMNRVDGQPEPVLLNWNRNLSPTWQRVSTSFVMPETSDGRFRIIFYLRALNGATDGSLWFDDIRITTGKRLPVRRGALKLARVNAQDGDWIQIAADYDFVIANASNLARFKAQKPAVNTWYYTLGWESITVRDAENHALWNGNTLVGYAGDFVPHSFAKSTNPGWFLPDAYGLPIQVPGGTTTRIFAMDLGDQTLRNFVFQNMRNFFGDVFGSGSALTPTGLYFDRLNNCLSYATPRYPTRPERLTKLHEYMQDFHNQVGSQGIKAIANGYISPWNTGDFAPLLQNGWVDGFLTEGFLVNIYIGTIRAPKDMANHLISAMNPSKTVVVMGRMFGNNPNEQRFNIALAGFYLVNHPNLYCVITGEGLNGPNVSESRVIPQLDLPIGQPLTSSYEMLAGSVNNGALYARRYTAGVALLNSSPTVSFTYTPTTYLRDYQGRSYRPNRPISIPPQTGLVLYTPQEMYNPR